MDCEKFVEKVQMDLAKILSDKYSNVIVEPVEVNKLQGQSYLGLSIRHDDSTVAEALNLGTFYELYQDGLPYENIMKKITDMVVTGFSDAPEIEVGSLNDYEKMKPHLITQIIGVENNADMLPAVPHQKMEDMAVVYRFRVGDSSKGQASILITNQMLEMYGITSKQLQKDALDVIQKNEPVSIKNMDEIMYELTNGFVGSIENPESPMWVATNESNFHGASVMAYPDFMEQAAKKLNDSFYLLPSSMHEVLLVPDSFNLKAQELKEMVTVINASEVSPEERLTDNAYHYDSESKVFEQAENFEKRMEKQKERASVLDALGEKKQQCASYEPKFREENLKEAFVL